MRPTFIATSFLIKNNPNGPNNSKITVTCTTNFKCKINDTKTKKQTKKQTRKQVSKISKAKVHFARNIRPQTESQNELFQTMSLSKKCFNTVLFPLLVLLPVDKSCLWVEPIVTSLFSQTLFGQSHLFPSLLPLPFQVARYLLALFHP